jgi:hypothetical protein
MAEVLIPDEENPLTRAVSHDRRRSCKLASRGSSQTSSRHVSTAARDHVS